MKRCENYKLLTARKRAEKEKKEKDKRNENINRVKFFFFFYFFQYLNLKMIHRNCVVNNFFTCFSFKLAFLAFYSNSNVTKMLN